MHKIAPQDLLLTACASALVMIAQETMTTTANDAPSTNVVQAAVKYAQAFQKLRDNHPRDVKNLIAAIPLQQLQLVFAFLATAFAESVLEFIPVQSGTVVKQPGKEPNNAN